MKLDHIGVVVKNLEESKKYYEDLYGFKHCSDIIHEPEQNVKLVFIRMGRPDAKNNVELIQPLGEDSAVYNFLNKTGGGIHHISYEVENLDEAIEHFKNMKALPIGKVYPGAGHNGQRVIWFYTRLKELIELIERKK